MKIFVIAGLTVLSAFTQAQTCKMELYGPQGEFITSVRTANDQSCDKALRGCRNWAAWYYAPVGSMCYPVRDDGSAVIDYVRHPDYDVYYGYPGSPYTRVPRVPPTTTRTTTTTVCEYDSRGRETCRTLPSTTTTTPGYSRPGTTTEVCDYYDDGSRRCRTIPSRVEPTPNPRPETRPNPSPVPTPTTNPEPAPVPTTQPSSDATRAIEAGETVIFNSALHMVVSIASPNFYNLKPQTGRSRDIIKDVARHYVAVTRGCNVGFCASDSVINLATSTYAAVAGIEYDGQFVIKTVDGRDTMTFDVNASSLAWTKGCTPENPGKVCIGNVVMRQSGRNVYFTVVGIQLDGKVVLENNDGPKKLTLNVNPETLIITR